MFANALRRQARSAFVAVASQRVAATIVRAAPSSVLPTLRLLSTTPARRQDVPVVNKTSQHPPSKQLFIGNLPYEATEADVREVLEQHGNVDSVRLILNPDGSSRGFGYAFFSTLEESINAFNSDVKIFSRLMRIDYTVPRPTYTSGLGLGSKRAPTPPSNVLYVGNLPFGTDEGEIRAKFEPFGALRSVRLATQDSGNFRGFCHIEFEKEDDAISAYESYAEEPLYMLDRNVRVDYAASRTTNKADPSASLYFFDFRGDGLAMRSALRAFDHEIVRTHFLRSRTTGELTPTGFVEFRSVEAAAAAKEKYNGTKTQFGPLNFEFAVSQPRQNREGYNDSVSARAQAGDRVRGGYNNNDF